MPYTKMDDTLKLLQMPLDDYIEQVKYDNAVPLENETGMSSKDGRVGMHCREDGILELRAGNARILLSSEGLISIKGSSLVSSTLDANLLTSLDNSVAINGHPLNFDWLEEDKWETAPVTFKQLQEKATYLTGSPAQGQKVVSFHETFDHKKLFLNASTKTSSYIDELENLLNETSS